MKNSSYLNDASESLQSYEVAKYPNTIKYIENPSKVVQLAAVRKSGIAIRYILNPCEEAQLVAVNKGGWILANINNPSEKVQLAAVKNFNYNGGDYDEFVKKFINSEKALELYKRLKNANSIIR